MANFGLSLVLVAVLLMTSQGVNAKPEPHYRIKSSFDDVNSFNDDVERVAELRDRPQPRAKLDEVLIIEKSPSLLDSELDAYDGLAAFRRGYIYEKVNEQKQPEKIATLQTLSGVDLQSYLSRLSDSLLPGNIAAKTAYEKPKTHNNFVKPKVKKRKLRGHVRKHKNRSVTAVLIESILSPAKLQPPPEIEIIWEKYGNSLRHFDFHAFNEKEHQQKLREIKKMGQHDLNSYIQKLQDYVLKGMKGQSKNAKTAHEKQKTRNDFGNNKKTSLSQKVKEFDESKPNIHRQGMLLWPPLIPIVRQGIVLRFVDDIWPPLEFDEK